MLAEFYFCVYSYVCICVYIYILFFIYIYIIVTQKSVCLAFLLLSFLCNILINCFLSNFCVKKPGFFVELCRCYCLNLSHVSFSCPTFPSIWLEEKDIHVLRITRKVQSTNQVQSWLYTFATHEKEIVLGHLHFCISNHEDWPEHSFLSSYSHFS